MSTPAHSPATRTRGDAVADRARASFASRCSPSAAARRWNSPVDSISTTRRPDRRGERVAAERRAVLAGADHAEHVAVRDDGRHGQDAAAERLAEQVHVGHDALAVARERLADAAEAGLDLVGDEQHVVALVQISRTARR